MSENGTKAYKETENALLAFLVIFYNISDISFVGNCLKVV